MVDSVYVWAWLPGSTTPVVAGRLAAATVRGRPTYTFQYGRSYRDNPAAVPLFTELPLEPGVQLPAPGLDVFGVILDATPDSWGRRVVNELLLGRRDRGSDPVELDLFTYMLNSGSDRIGGLDFQESATEYVARGTKDAATLEELLRAAEMIENDEPLPESLARALFLGTTAGGARPKAIVNQGDRSFIAKFPSTTDQLPYVKYEAVAMELAKRVGIRTAAVDLHRVAGRDVLLVRRFDRPGDGTRRMQVSALTILGMNPEAARGATSYPAFADHVRASFTEPRGTLLELFKRVVLNVMVRNTDDHARNQAAFWDGRHLTLTPAFDITPARGRRDSVASHPMAIAPDGDNRSLLAVCVKAAPAFQLTSDQAKQIISEMDATVRGEWHDAAEMAQLTQRQTDDLWESSILNPAIYWEA
jgi:serine/threonine-protein kinase HipA